MYFPNPFKFKGMQPNDIAPFSRSFRPDLAFWAGVIALILAISGWRRRIVFANWNRVRPVFLRRFEGSQSQRGRFLPNFGTNPIWLYLALLYCAARDLMGLLAASYPHRLRIAPHSAPILAAMRQGPCLFLTGHVHHFEALGSFLAHQGVPLKAIARPMSRQWAQNWLIRLRERIGLPVIWSVRPANHSKPAFWMRQAHRHLQAGGCLAMLWDQKPRHSGVSAAFFGESVSCDPLPAFVLEALLSQTEPAPGERPEAGPNFAVPIYAGFLQPSGEVRLTLVRSDGLSRMEPTDKRNREEARAKRAQEIARPYHRWLEAVTLRFPCYAYWLLHRRFGDEGKN